MPEWKELLNAAGHQAPVSADGFRRSRPKDRTQESPHRLPPVFVTPSDSSTKSAATESQAGGRLLSESCYPIILHKADADPYRLLEIQGRNDARDARGSPREAYGSAEDHSKLRQL